MKTLTFTCEQMERAVNRIATERALDGLCKKKEWAREVLGELIEESALQHPDNYTSVEIGNLQAKILVMFLDNKFGIESEQKDWYREPSDDGRSVKGAIGDTIRDTLHCWFGDTRLEEEIVTDLVSNVFKTLCIDKDMQDVDHDKFCGWMTDGVNLDDINFE